MITEQEQSAFVAALRASAQQITSKDSVEVLHSGLRTETCNIRISDGYMLKRSANVAAFYADVIGDCNRAFPTSTCSSVVLDGGLTLKKYPSIMLIDSDDTELAEIYFPEFEGWNVHCAHGGKTLSICLTKD